MRIVSLLPSSTELVDVLGLSDQLHAVSHECDVPARVATLPRATRSILAQGLDEAEIDRRGSAAIREGRPLYQLVVEVVEAVAPDLIVTQGLCDVCAVSEELVRELQARWDALPGATEAAPPVLMLEWPDPPFSGGHRVPEQVLRAGGRPLLGAPGVDSRRLRGERRRRLGLRRQPPVRPPRPRRGPRRGGPRRGARGAGRASRRVAST